MKIQTTNSNLTARTIFPNLDVFYPDIKDGKYGFNTSVERGADTFHPFKSLIENSKLLSANYFCSTTIGDKLDVAGRWCMRSTNEPAVLRAIYSGNFTGYYMATYYSSALDSVTYAPNGTLDGRATITGLISGRTIYVGWLNSMMSGSPIVTINGSQFSNNLYTGDILNANYNHLTDYLLLSME